MRHRLPLKAFALATSLVLTLAALGCTGGPAPEAVSSRSYSGHENDQDANNFVRAYPAMVGKRLDDCQTCHSAGVTGTSTATVYNPCSYCHIRAFNDTSYTTGVPLTYADTLNAFGLAYKSNGRSQAAFTVIGGLDSDGDGYSNDAEIADSRFPGNVTSKPGQPLATTVTLTQAQVAAMTAHSEFLLMNTSKQQYDFYATYEGPTVKDLLTAAGVDPTDAAITGIDVFAPDGFKQNFTILNVNNQYPDGIFRTVPGQPFTPSTLDFVQYPSPLPAAYSDNDALTNLWLTIAFKRDGSALSNSYYDTITKRQEGEGPFRVIPPQSVAGKPDRGSGQVQANPDDGWNNVSAIDHNAGKSVRGVVAIRVNPMPAGYEEIDTTNGWSLITDKKIVIYGYGVH
jgi:hypothetical protein